MYMQKPQIKKHDIFLKLENRLRSQTTFPLMKNMTIDEMVKILNLGTSDYASVIGVINDGRNQHAKVSDFCQFMSEHWKLIHDMSPLAYDDFAKNLRKTQVLIGSLV